MKSHLKLIIEPGTTDTFRIRIQRWFEDICHEPYVMDVHVIEDKRADGKPGIQE